MYLTRLLQQRAAGGGFHSHSSLFPSGASTCRMFGHPSHRVPLQQEAVPNPRPKHGLLNQTLARNRPYWSIALEAAISPQPRPPYFHQP